MKHLIRPLENHAYNLARLLIFELIVHQFHEGLQANLHTPVLALLFNL